MRPCHFVFQLLCASHIFVFCCYQLHLFFDRNTQEIVGAQKRKHKRAMWNQLCGNMFNNKRAYVTWWALWRELPTLVIHFSVKRWKNPVSNSIGFVQGSSFTPKGNSIYRYLPFFRGILVWTQPIFGRYKYLADGIWHNISRKVIYLMYFFFQMLNSM